MDRPVIRMRSISIISCVWIASAIAQPVLSDDDMPTAGTVYAYHDVAYLKPGPPGEGVRWDYTALPTGTIVPYQWTTSDVAPGAGAFPEHALVQSIPGEPARYYLETDTTLLFLGSYSDTALLRFDPPLRSVVFPTSIGMQWRDSGVVALTGSGRIAMRTVLHTVKADAWGTLSMPYGVVENVLRLRSEFVLTDPKYPEWPVRREVRYSWHSNQTPMPLLMMIERTGWPPPERILRWLDGSWREGEASLFQPIRLRVFPDPCDDVATIDLPAARPDRTVLQLIDGGGNVTKYWQVEFTSPETRRLVLPMSDVPSGHYTLAWVGTNGTLGTVRLERR